MTAHQLSLFFCFFAMIMGFLLSVAMYLIRSLIFVCRLFAGFSFKTTERIAVYIKACRLDFIMVWVGPT
jgi:hypothetical protein